MKIQFAVVTILLAGKGFAAETISCRINGTPQYRAELSGVGDGRAVTLTFSRPPNAEAASKAVETCMKVAIERDPKHELLGSAWVGEDHFPLTTGKEDLAYSPKDGKIRPFGLSDAIKGLKHK